MRRPDPFEAIAKEAIEKAEQVKVPFGVFVEGLKTIYQTAQSRYEGALAEHKARGGDDE